MNKEYLVLYGSDFLMQDLPKRIERMLEMKNIVWKDIQTNNSWAHRIDKVPSLSNLYSANTKPERR